MFRIVILLLILSTPSLALAEDREASETTIVETPVKPRSQRGYVSECGTDCESLYRLPPEQMKRLREIEGKSPGQIIRLNPESSSGQRSGRSSSRTPGRFQ